VTDTTALLHGALRDGKGILFEAAQGALLDVDHGTYPYVTSSHSTPAGVWSGSGVPARRLDKIVGVIKAYTSRVGRGPFPTELNDGPTGIGERIRKVGREFGTVTGRPRRVGWFDAVAARYSAAICDADELALMLLDVLSGLPELSIATAYDTPHGQTTSFPADAARLETCRPVLETHPGWDADLTAIRRRHDLPDAARRYVDRIEALLERPIRIISVGPDREQTILE
jgi:adenylosuccinate synthase